MLQMLFFCSQNFHLKLCVFITHQWGEFWWCLFVSRGEVCVLLTM